VLYDLAPAAKQAEILDRALRNSPALPTDPGYAGPLATLNVQPYFMHFVFQAEMHTGLFQRFAGEQLGWWKINPETQTFPEMWTTGDWSHGWGGTPLIQMSAHMLGVTPKSPGFATIELQPLPLQLTFAKGTVPTPHGDVEVSWKRAGDGFHYQVDLPPGTGGELDLSGVAQAGRSTVIVDGAASRPYGQPLTLSPGTHTIVLVGSQVPAPR